MARAVERAVSKKKPVFAVRIANVEPAPSLELFVSDTQWIDAYPGRLEPHIGRLANLLAEEEGRKMPGAEPEPPQPRRLPRWAVPLGAAASVLLVLGAGVVLWQGDIRVSDVAKPDDPALLTKPVWVDGHELKQKEQVAGVQTHDFDDETVEGALDRPAGIAGER